MRLILLFLLLPFVGKSQNDTTKYYKSLDYGWNYQRLKARAALVLPSDTVTNKLGIVTIDTSVFVGNGVRWAKVGGAGGTTIDTTSLSNRINTKLSISDSATYYTKFRSDTSRTNIYNAIEAVGDTASVVKATVHNAEGTTLTKGTVVYLFGATGNVASVKRAYNTSDTFSSKTFAIVRDDIGVGQNGIVITQGVVDKLNLGSFTEGDIVWLDSIPGQFTKTKPVAPYHQVFVGVVERANNGNGQLFVKVQNGYELGELHNVSVNGQADNDVLYYQSSTKLWKAKSAYLLVDTSSLSSRINTKLATSDSTIYEPKFRSDTARTNLYNAINTKVNLSDSTLYQTKFRSDTARTNTYTAIAGKFTLPSLTSGSVLFSDGTTIAQKNANFFWDNTNNRLGLGTTSPANAFDVVRGTAGTMGRGTFESGSFSFNGDAKVGVYTSSATSTDGAGIAFAQTNLQANSRYPGFEMQYVYSSTVANNAWRVNYTERSSAGAVQNYTANVLAAYANGTVMINPTASGVTASAKLLVGRASSTFTFDVNGSARANQFYLSALNTAPASASATGTTGEIRIDANYIYICTATNTWKRVAIATW
jgi:hypothetical protein